jgi:BON domain
MMRLPYDIRPTAVVSAALLAIALIFATGCKHQAAPARTDQQMATDIQAKVTAEPALHNQTIQVSVVNGVATLNGAVTSDAARALACNEAGNTGGVKTVVNNLAVKPAQNLLLGSEPTASWAPPPAHQHALGQKSAESHYKNSSKAAQSSYTPVEPQPSPAPAEVAQAPAPPPPPPAPPQPEVKQLTLAAGTVVPVRITETIDSKTAQPNDAFHGALASDLMSGGVVAIPRGAAVMGRVVDAKEATHFKGNSLLSLELTQLSARGQRISLVTDTFNKEGTGRGKNTAEKTGAGAAFGAIVGALAGGGKGAAIGGLAGAGAGAGINAATRGEQVVIPTETVIQFRLQSPVTVSVTLPPNGNQDAEVNPALQQR